MNRTGRLSFRRSTSRSGAAAALTALESVRIVVESAIAPVPASVDVFDKVNDVPAAAKKDTLARDASMGSLQCKRLIAIVLRIDPSRGGRREAAE